MGSYIEGKPAWLVDPENSVIRVLSRKEFERMSEAQIQSIFHKQHVVVHDQFTPSLNFDERGLETLARLDKPIVLHGE